MFFSWIQLSVFGFMMEIEVFENGLRNPMSCSFLFKIPFFLEDTDLLWQKLSKLYALKLSLL